MSNQQTPSNPSKKLYRSTTDKVFAGVSGGMAVYFNTDATVIRLAWVLLVLLTGIFPGLIAYIVAAIVIPPDTAQPS